MKCKNTLGSGGGITTGSTVMDMLNGMNANVQERYKKYWLGIPNDFVPAVHATAGFALRYRVRGYFYFTFCGSRSVFGSTGCSTAWEEV